MCQSLLCGMLLWAVVCWLCSCASASVLLCVPWSVELPVLRKLLFLFIPHFVCLLPFGLEPVAVPVVLLDGHFASLFVSLVVALMVAVVGWIMVAAPGIVFGVALLLFLVGESSLASPPVAWTDVVFLAMSWWVLW